MVCPWSPRLSGLWNPLDWNLYCSQLSEDWAFKKNTYSSEIPCISSISLLSFSSWESKERINITMASGFNPVPFTKLKVTHLVSFSYSTLWFWFFFLNQLLISLLLLDTCLYSCFKNSIQVFQAVRESLPSYFFFTSESTELCTRNSGVLTLAFMQTLCWTG